MSEPPPALKLAADVPRQLGPGLIQKGLYIWEPFHNTRDIGEETTTVAISSTSLLCTWRWRRSKVQQADASEIRTHRSWKYYHPSHMYPMPLAVAPQGLDRLSHHAVRAYPTARDSLESVRPDVNYCHSQTADDARDLGIGVRRDSNRQDCDELQLSGILRKLLVAPWLCCVFVYRTQAPKLLLERRGLPFSAPLCSELSSRRRRAQRPRLAGILPSLTAKLSKLPSSRAFREFLPNTISFICQRLASLATSALLRRDVVCRECFCHRPPVC
jgi:hypothetical protein